MNNKIGSKYIGSFKFASYHLNEFKNEDLNHNDIGNTTFTYNNEEVSTNHNICGDALTKYNEVGDISTNCSDFKDVLTGYTDVGDISSNFSDIREVLTGYTDKFTPAFDAGYIEHGLEIIQEAPLYNEDECYRIIDFFKKSMNINDNDDVDYLNNGEIKKLFFAIDKLYKASKSQLSDVFSKSLSNFLSIQKLLLDAYKDYCNEEISGNKFPPPPPLPPLLRENRIIKWENVRLERNINGVRVLFHFPTISRPQLQILSKLTNALKYKEHAILESPTGTGKTAAIISGVLSWVYQSYMSNSSTFMKLDKPNYRVIYLTRTHAQIQQISNSIKQSCFMPYSCILASRKLLCAYKNKYNPDDDDIILCRKLVSSTDRLRVRNKKDSLTCSGKKSIISKKIGRDICPYYANMSCKSYSVLTSIRYMTDSNASWDIEDLNGYCDSKSNDPDIGCGCKSDMDAISKKRVKMQNITSYFKKERDNIFDIGKGCPYYTAKAISQVADFITCPYPYVIAPHIVVKGYNISSKVMSLLDKSYDYNDCKNEILEVMHDKMDYLNSNDGNGFFGSLANTILIFDEGHNVENSCMEEGSCDLNFNNLSNVLKWLKGLKYKLDTTNISNDSSIDYSITKMTLYLSNSFKRLTLFLQDFLNKLYEFVQLKCKNIDNYGGISPARWKKYSKKRSGGWKGDGDSNDDINHPTNPNPSSNDVTMLYSWDRYNEGRMDGSRDFMREFNLDLLKVYVMYCTMLRISSYGKTMDLAGLYFSAEYRKMIENFLSILVLLCYSPESFNVSITTYNDNNRISIWLLNPSLIFNELSIYAHSIIIASGTLTPIQAVINSLGDGFSSRVKLNILSATQTLPMDQFMVLLLTHLDNNRRLECNYSELKNDMFICNLGNIIGQMISSLPGGTLIFFPNRNVINKCLDIWSRCNFITIDGIKCNYSIMDEIKRIKINIYKEPTDAKNFNIMIQDIRCKDRYIILAVFRSHFSEGINLKLSSILLVGLPFPCIVSPLVDISRRFNKISTSNDKYDWYLRETFRAVNQAIGRCIRNKDDRGIVILLDNRYTQHFDYLSSWIHPYTSTHDHVNKILHKINHEFKFLT